MRTIITEQGPVFGTLVQIMQLHKTYTVLLVAIAYICTSEYEVWRGTHEAHTVHTEA